MQEQLNVVVVFTDDHAQWAAGCYGNKEIRTPTLNHLAETGVLMQNAFTPSPVCSPARASFFTGLFPSQHGVHDWIHPDFEHPAWIQSDTPTIAQILQQQGYQTALCGKWHLGENNKAQPGFDYWSAVDRNYPPSDGTYITTAGEAIARKGYHTQLITDDATKYLRNRDETKPFFLFVGYFGTHSPWSDHPERLVNQYRQCFFADVPDGPTYTGGRLTGESLAPTRFNRKEALAQYYASITHIDEGIGRIVDELEAQEIRHKTLFIYTSDHGLNAGQHGIWGKGNGTRPLNMLEESIRVPLIINCPYRAGSPHEDDKRIGMKPASYDGQILGGQVRSELVDHTDLFATILDFAGISSQTSKVHLYPGKSFKKILQAAPGNRDWKEVQIAEYGYVRMARSSRYKLVIRDPLGTNEFYDLYQDPGELNNLYAPDNPIVLRLQALIDDFFLRHTASERDGKLREALRQHNYVEAWRDEKE